MDKSIIGLSPDLIIHPGETLAEILEARGMTQRELALRTGVTEKHVSSIIHGKSPITNAYARRLEIALGTAGSFWTNLQANYDRELSDYEERAAIPAEELSVAESLSETVEDLCGRGLLERETRDNPRSLVLALRRLGHVTSLLSIPRLTAGVGNPYAAYYSGLYGTVGN